MNIELLEIEKLIPYANNPRKNLQAVDKVAASIKEYGFKQPIVIDKENVVVVGHTRLMAAQKLGIDKVPVVIADDLTDTQIKAYRLADNRVNEEAEWDRDLLALEIEDLKAVDFDLELTGFNDEEIEQFFNKVDFSPVVLDESDRLDEKNKIICPKCKHAFET